MKTILLYIAVVSIIIVVGIGSFKLERWWHYKTSYQKKVQEEVQQQLIPLEKRVSQLEAEIKALKNQ